MQSPEDDLVVFNACGITTKWRPPAGMLKCAVKQCQQIFTMRKNLVRYYKENHAIGSILCTLCNKLIRTNHQFELYVAHYRRMVNAFSPISLIQSM